MRVFYRPRALADIHDIARYLEKRSPAGARNVIRAIHESIQVIADQPYGSQATDYSDIRVKVVRRYRYKIFYRVPDADTVRIVHVRHKSRRPWTGEGN